jgi:hypothetical protein
MQVNQPIQPAFEEGCQASADYVDPPAELLEKLEPLSPSLTTEINLEGEQPWFVAYRPAGFLRIAAATQDPIQQLVRAAITLMQADGIQTTVSFVSAPSTVKAMAFADLSVAGRASITKFQQNPPAGRDARGRGRIRS